LTRHSLPIIVLTISITALIILGSRMDAIATIVGSITPDGNMADWSLVTTTVTDPDEPPTA